MPFNIGALIGGLGQGLQRNEQIAADLKMRAVQLQQAQMGLDEQKRQLAGRAALFQGMNSGAGGFGTGPTPPLPGQASQPMQQPQRGGQMPAQTGPGAPQAPIGGTAAPSQPATQAPPGGAPMGTQDPFSIQGQYLAMQQIAGEIRRRNPGIDDQTLAEATMQAMDIMKNMSMLNRPAAQLALVDERGRQASSLEEQRQGGRMDLQTAKNQGALQRAAMTANAAMNRAKFIQQSIDSRALSGQGNRSRIASQRTALTAAMSQLAASQRQLSSLAYAGITDENDPRVQAALRQVEQAKQKLDLIAKAADVSDAGATPQEQENVIDFSTLKPKPKIAK